MLLSSTLYAGLLPDNLVDGANYLVDYLSVSSPGDHGKSGVDASRLELKKSKLALTVRAVTGAATGADGTNPVRKVELYQEEWQNPRDALIRKIDLCVRTLAKKDQNNYST